MKKLALFIALTLLAASVFTFGAFAVDGTLADAVPESYGVMADFNPEAITEDISGIIGDQAEVQISGSKGIVGLAGHTNDAVDNISVALDEENGEKFVRFGNAANYNSGKYSQLYFNLDTAVFTAPEEYYFTLTFRLSGAYTCTDGNNRAVLARLVDGVQNNCVLVNRDDLASKDFSQWTTATFCFTPANAPYVLRLIIFCDPTDYIDIKDLKIYSASAAASAGTDPEPVTEAPATEAPATEAPATEAPATEAPATEAPATEAPATEAPATEAPKTEAPATEAPKTEAPAEEGSNVGVIVAVAVAVIAIAAVAIIIAKKAKK